MAFRLLLMYIGVHQRVLRQSIYQELAHVEKPFSNISINNLSNPIKESSVFEFVCLSGNLLKGSLVDICHWGFCLMSSSGIDCYAPFNVNPLRLV